MKRRGTLRWFRAIESALKKLKIRYWIFVSFWNPYHHGMDESLIAGLQWVEFFIELPNKRVGAIIVNTGWGFNSGPHKYHLRFMETKKRFLEEHGIEYLHLKKEHVHQEQMIFISRWYNKQRKVSKSPANKKLRKLRQKSKEGRVYK